MKIQGGHGDICWSSFFLLLLFIKYFLRFDINGGKNQKSRVPKKVLAVETFSCFPLSDATVQS